jgi:hypothetical protein
VFVSGSTVSFNGIVFASFCLYIEYSWLVTRDNRGPMVTDEYRLGYYGYDRYNDVNVTVSFECRPVRRLRNGRPPTECDNTGCCIIQFGLLMMSTVVLETCRGI